MDDLRTTADIVKKVLQNYPASRNSDDMLYVFVCKETNPKCIEKSFIDVLLARKEYGIPAFETVRRTRQKVQAECPELAAAERIKTARAEKEPEFREFARSAI